MSDLVVTRHDLQRGLQALRKLMKQRADEGFALRGRNAHGFRRALSRPIGRVVLALSVLLLLPVSAPGEQEPTEPVRIGVLAKRGPQRCLEKWGPTAEYLTSEIPGCAFTIVPLGFDEIYPTVERGELDFILANPSSYVGLEQLHCASRILTLKNLRLGEVYTVYGGVIFCRADRKDIQSLSDLAGKTFMAVEQTSLGGWHAAWLELKERGIDPYRDFAGLRFGGTHDAVVRAVRDSQVEAGTVRTDTLERMAQEGKIRLEEFRVIRDEHRDNADLPFLCSTHLYPEWPLAKAKHTSDELAERVTAALLRMSPDTPAARAARCAGWTIPHNYQPVHECLKTLRVAPYDDFGEVTFGAVLRRYWLWLLSIAALLTTMIVTTAWVLRLNRVQKRLRAELESELSSRSRTEEDLRETRDSLENLITCANAPIIVWDPASRITRFNRAFERLTGYAANEVIGRELSLLFPESSKEESLSKIDRTLSGEHWESVEIPIRCKSGETRLALWNSANIHSEDGTTLLATIAQGVDITERKRAEEESARLREELHQAQKMEAVGRLAGGVAHDFNNLLTTIFGYTELARETLAADHGAIQSLECVAEAAEQAAGVTRALLTFSRQAPTEKRPIDLRTVVARSTRLLGRVLSASIELATDPPDEPPVRVNGDDTQLQQVIMNLAINARDAMPGGGTLRITVARTAAEADASSADADATAPRARLVVSDTGTGMSAEVARRVFEPFFTTKPPGEGTGLGLAIIHGIVRDHGGTIDVHSEPGRGTTFTVTLPSLEAEAAAETDGPAVVVPRGRGELILLAEDSRHVRGIINSALQARDYEVLAVADGDALLDAFEQHHTRVRLLVVDFDLPKRDGRACLREIRSGGARTPAIVVTAQIDADLEDQLDEDTVLLRKPFQIAELTALVGRVLGVHRGAENEA